MARRRAVGIMIAILVGLAGLVALFSRADLLHRLFTSRPVTPDHSRTHGYPGPEARATLPAQVASDTVGAGRATEQIGVQPEAAGTTAAVTASTSSTSTPALPATVTLTPQPPLPTGTPLPFRIVGPLAIDGPRRKLYARVQVHGVGRIGIFSAEDGSRLGVLYLDGGVAVDPKRGRLLVDDPATGLHVLDAETGEEVKLIQIPLQAKQSPVGGQRPTALPPADSPRVQPAAVEPSGQVAIARWGTVWIGDVDASSAHAVSLPSVYYERGLTIKELKSAGPGEPLWILDGSGGETWAQNISVHRLTNLADTEAPELRMWDWSAQRSSLAVWSGGAAVVAEDFYEGAWWEPLGQDSGKRSNTMYPAELTWLPGRNLLLAQVPSPAGDLLIVNPHDMTVVGSLPIRLAGRLAGYDPEGDRLLVTSDTEVLVLPFQEASQAPSTEKPEQSLIKRTDQGDNLVTPSGLVDLDADTPRHVDRFWCKASPAFETDQTAFCGAVGKGLYRTTDGGRSYQTAMAGLSNWAIDDLYLSPSFAQDRTMFVSVDPHNDAAALSGTLYRSGDAGAHWRPVGTKSAVAFAPNFKTSRRMYAFAFGGQRALGSNLSYRSDDAGESWREMGRLPDASAAIRKLYVFDDSEIGERVLLGIGASSLFSPTDHMKFWPNQDPRIYRSIDEGRSWEVVVSREGVIWFDRESIVQVDSANEGQALFVFGWERQEPHHDSRTPPPTPLPDPISRRISQATTLRSYDLGATWQYVEGRDDRAFPDPDRPALAVYTLPTSTPRPSATPAP